MGLPEVQRLLVDGFEIRWCAEGDRVRVTVSKDGEEASAGIDGPRDAWPPRESIEHLAMTVWQACHEMRGRLDRATPEQKAGEA